MIPGTKDDFGKLDAAVTRNIDRLRGGDIPDIGAAQLVLCEVACPHTLFPQGLRGSLGAK